MSRKLTTRSKTTSNVRRRTKRVFLRSRKKLIRLALVSSNLALLVGVLVFVTRAPSSGQVSLQSVVSNSHESSEVTGPMDQVSSADIAVDVARTIGLPESNSVTNHADSVNLAVVSTSADTSVVSKPQVIASALPTKKDIRTYTTAAGDTISSIAAKMGVTSDSIRWSNSITGSRDTIAVGKQLMIPPAGTSGIVYVVKAGDTPDSLAAKFNSSKASIVTFNDAEIDGITTGESILIPDGSIQAPAQTTSAYSYYASSSSSQGFAWGGSSAIYGRNGYDYGYCTWYVANRINMPANWGNADTWPRGARASGWTVSNTPRKGAIAWGAPIRMHVAYVEDVSADGSMVKYSDMNNLAGWGRRGDSDWVPASYFPGYIYQ
ncbi:MAG: CHAP domain-containing protein [Candidatus Saccharimonadales bacterium]